MTALKLPGVIFDVDGVVIDSPHERAWREALQGFVDPALLTTALYQQHVAGKPRLAGARAVLEHFGVPGAAEKAILYAERKQKRVEELIIAGAFNPFPDALRFIDDLNALGFRLAVASSSKNANQMMEQIQTASGRTLIAAFDANVCGRELRRGKPDPEIFLLAAAELRLPPCVCVVIEDAPAGIQAAKGGGMRAVGVARVHDAAMLEAAQADLVVGSLDNVDRAALEQGLLVARAH